MRSVLRVLPPLLLLTTVAVAVAAVLWLAASWFLGLAAETQAAVAALTGVVLVPFITFVTTRSLERRRSLEQSLREKKTQLYDDMVKGLMSIFNLSSSRAKNVKSIANNPNELLKFYGNMTPRLITYGSRNVIRAWNVFRNGAGENPPPALMMLRFENILRAMRADLGHRTWTQPQGELLRLFVNDVENVDFKTLTVKKSSYIDESA